MGPVLAMLLATGAQAPVAEVVALEIGTVLEVEQRADETRVFRVELEAGRAYLLEVGQRELDVIVEITAPDGSTRGFDAPLLRLEPERLLIEPETTGFHVVSLSSRQSRGGSPRYRVQVIEWPISGSGSEIGRYALAAETQAAHLTWIGGAENWPLAVDAYAQAASSWARLSEGAIEARARMALAWLLYGQLSDWEAAHREAGAAAELYLERGEQDLYASALQVQGVILVEAASEARKAVSAIQPQAHANDIFQRSLELLARARTIKQQSGDSYELGRIVNDIGLAHFARGNWARAREHFQVAAGIFAEIEEWSQELLAISNMATTDYSQGDLVAALDAYHRTLDLIDRDHQYAGRRADLLNNMATAHRALGNYDKALAYFVEALAEHEKKGSLSGRGRSLTGIGVTYLSIGEPELAREYLEQSLPVRREARDGAGQVTTLLQLGNIAFDMGDVAAATELHKEAEALAVSRGQQARARLALGRDLAVAERIDEAMQSLEQGRVDAQEASMPVVVADALLERGMLLAKIGRLDEATAEIEKSLALYEELGWQVGAARASYELARTHRLAGSLPIAEEWAAKSVRRTEQLRSLIVNPELRATFLARQREFYAQHVDVALETGRQSDEPERRRWIERALATAELARTRAMLDLLHEATIGVSRTADPAQSQRRASLHQSLAGLRFRQDRLLARKHDPEALSQLGADLNRVETELQVLETELRESDPRHASIIAPSTLDAAGLQAGLDDDTILLQYQLGVDRSWLFAVTADDIKVHILPADAALEALALRAFAALRTLDADPALRQNRDAVLQQLARLLIPPEAAQKKRLLIAADGALHYIPFAVLPVTNDKGRGQPLITQHEIVSIPSMSVLTTQRQIRAARSAPRMTIAVIADPVLDDDDPRIGNRVAWLGPRQAIAGEADQSRSPVPGLRRLPGAGTEAAAIASLISSDQRLVATGFDATRGAVLGLGLKEFRIVHFATHALVDDRYPALSALALSRFDANRKALDPLLRVHDIYELELRADLVTLSACETALGRALRGEGLVGLTRAFMYAGSSSVVASLWRVPDRATAELMRRFYEAQLREGKNPPAALRQAQLSLMAERARHDPHYWGAFVAYGDWHDPAYGRGQSDERTNGPGNAAEAAPGVMLSGTRN